MLTMLGMCAPGDDVLITSPRFTSYDTAVRLCGGNPIPVPTFEHDDFALDVEEIEKRITPRTRMFVLVSPNNPTGAVTPPDKIRAIAQMAIRHDLIIVADEIYGRMIYEPNEHLSIATLPGMRERTITLNGFSKTYSMTGWRVGYLAAPKDLVHMLTEPRHTLSINACTISQHAALAALTGPQEPIDAMIDEYAERRAWLMPALDDIGHVWTSWRSLLHLHKRILFWATVSRLLPATPPGYGGDAFPRNNVRGREHGLHTHQLSATSPNDPRGSGSHLSFSARAQAEGERAPL